MKLVKTFIPLLGLFVISSIAAHAQLLNFDVGGGVSGAAVLGSSGDTWNTTGGSGGPLTVTYTGSTSTATLTLGNYFIYADGSATDGPLDGPGVTDLSYSGPPETAPPSPNGTPLNPNLFGTYDIGVGFITGDTTVDYTGLADNTVYTLVLYGRNQYGADGREFTVTSPQLIGVSESLVDEESPTYTSSLDATDSTPTDRVYDGNYVRLFLKSTSGGALDLTLSGGGEFDLSGGQLEEGILMPAPEPGSVSMMAAGLGMLALLAYRRRAKLS